MVAEAGPEAALRRVRALRDRERRSPRGDVRHQSVKRVASAVGDGAVAVQLLHLYLEGLRPPAPRA